MPFFSFVDISPSFKLLSKHHSRNIMKRIRLLSTMVKTYELGPSMIWSNALMKQSFWVQLLHLNVEVLPASIGGGSNGEKGKDEGDPSGRGGLWGEAFAGATQRPWAAVGDSGAHQGNQDELVTSWLSFWKEQSLMSVARSTVGNNQPITCKRTASGLYIDQ
jgi:hypothetical protein